MTRQRTVIDRRRPNIKTEPDVVLRLLGGFEITVDGQRHRIPESSQRLVAFVALRERPPTRGLAAGTLWPDRTEERAAAGLRCALWRVGTPGGRTVIDARGPELALAAGVRTDVADFERIGWSLSTTGDGSEAPEIPHRFAFGADLLPDWYDDWVLEERARLEQLSVMFTERLVDALLAVGRRVEALDAALRLVRTDPLRERSQLALLKVHASEGSHHRVRELADRYRDLVTDEIGFGVSAEFDEVADRLATPAYA